MDGWINGWMMSLKGSFMTHYACYVKNILFLKCIIHKKPDRKALSTIKSVVVVRTRHTRYMCVLHDGTCVCCVMEHVGVACLDMWVFCDGTCAFVVWLNMCMLLDGTRVCVCVLCAGTCVCCVMEHVCVAWWSMCALRDGTCVCCVMAHVCVAWWNGGTVVSSLKQRQSHASLKMPWALKLPLHLPLSLSLSLLLRFFRKYKHSRTHKRQTHSWTQHN